jgi:hypothetical protein
MPLFILVNWTGTLSPTVVQNMPYARRLLTVEPHLHAGVGHTLPALACAPAGDGAEEGQTGEEQRQRRWPEKDVGALVADFAKRGLWSPLSISEPKPYPPDNEDFSDSIRVIHVL